MDTENISRINALPCAELKQRAWNTLVGNAKKSILFLLFYCLVIGVISILLDAEMWGFDETSAPLKYILASTISAILCYFIIAPSAVGYYKFYLERSRNFPEKYSTLFFGYKKYIRNTAAILLTDIIFYGLSAIACIEIFIVCMILIGIDTNASSTVIPVIDITIGKAIYWTVLGIVSIALFSFILYKTFALIEFFPFALADNNKTGAFSLLKSFWKKTSPYNLKMIKLWFSFFGWWVLAVITLGIALLWVAPYWCYAKAELYKEIINENQPDVIENA